MGAVIVNILKILILVEIQYVCLAKDRLSVGFLFNQLSEQSMYPLNSTIHKKRSHSMPVEYTPVIKQISSTDSYEASKTICNMLQADEGLGAVFGAEKSTTTPIVESVVTNFGVPYIMTSWSPPNDQEYRYIFNFFPHADLFAKGLADIVRNHQWTNFAILYETEEGLARMQEILKLQEYQIDGKKNRIVMKQLGPGPDYRPLLKKINSTEGNIILDCKTENIIPILLQAKSLNMLDLTDSYLLTSLDTHTLDFSVLDTTANITTIRLLDHHNDYFKNTIRRWEIMEFDIDPQRSKPIDVKSIKTETGLLQDALTLFTESANDLSIESGIQAIPISCSGEVKSSDGGRINRLMKTRPIGMAMTGPVLFDNFGNRIDFNIYVDEALNGQNIATWHARSENLTFLRTANQTIDAAVLNLQKMTVIVSSKIVEPYLMKVEGSDNLEGNAMYEGYAMDLIAGIAKLIGFKFEFRLTEDNKNGNWDEQTRRWTGVIGDLLERRAHLGICDLTITHERREVVDFSMPFMNLGISILYKKPDKKDINMFAFLDPFSITVWIYTATLYLVISIVLFFISRMTPGDWENPHPCEEEPEELENMWGIKNCMWLTLGSIMTQGCDILPKGISSRMAVSMWWFFCLIMSSSYTANLAAFLTKANLEAPIDGAEALAKQTKIKYGALKDGSTESFFRNSNFSLYQRMWQTMKETRPSVFVTSNKDGVHRVQNTKNAQYAFLMESTGIEFELQTKCDLKQIGNWLDSKSYGIAMPMNAPYRSAINKAVLKMAESGELGLLKKKWWKEQRKEKSCDELDKDDEDDEGELALALVNVGGVFLVLGVGIALSYVLALVEFLWNVRNVSVEEHISYCEALKLELKFAGSFWISRKRAKPLLSESSSAHSNKTDKTDNKSVEQSILRNDDSIHTSQ